MALTDSADWGDVTPLVEDADASSDGDVSAEVHQAPVVVTGLKVTPQSTLAIQLEQGTSQTLGLGAALVYSDGVEVPVAADEIIWTFSDSTIATTDEDNVPMATGLAGGQVLIVAIHAGLHAQCSVTVQLLIPDPVIVDGMSAEEVSLFDSGIAQDDPGAPSMVYPLAGSVIPRGMKPPVFQWQAGLSKYFKLVLVGAQGFSITVYTMASSFAPTPDQWGALAGLAGSAVSATLVGASSLEEGGPRLGSSPLQIEVANADLSGSVYYWEVQTGSIVRLDSNPFAPTAEPVFEDAAPGSGGQGVCRGCHTLSQDGSRLAYVFESKGAGDLGVSWAQNPQPEILAAGSGALATTASFGPDATRLAIASDARLWLADVTPGIADGYEELQEIFVVPSEDGRVMSPAWSPDGSALIYSYAPSVTGDQSDLILRFLNEESGLFGAPQTLLSGSDFPGRGHLIYPTWSPDSQVIVTKATENIMGKAPFPLLMLDASGDATVELLKGSPPEFAHGQPSFSPFMEGGYYWLVFYSNRPYGTIKTGAEKQLWVMAIDQDAGLETDPSHAPFWLPGQDVTAVNLSGYWAKPVCAHEGEICLTDEDCCISHACSLDPELGVAFCEDIGCTVPGQYCDAKSENCCEGYSCQQSLAGGFSCQPDPDGTD
ncbi:MAG: hypothetical protein CL940_08695 [Deltaproteobacteria bacterium]|nr:hypothetical protein [Deltaproteobacteria bacterium]